MPYVRIVFIMQGSIHLCILLSHLAAMRWITLISCEPSGKSAWPTHTSRKNYRVLVISRTVSNWCSTNVMLIVTLMQKQQHSSRLGVWARWVCKWNKLAAMKKKKTELFSLPHMKQTTGEHEISLTCRSGRASVDHQPNFFVAPFPPCKSSKMSF